jgi:hypothetical protein
MKNDTGFRSPLEELEYLNSQVAEIKVLLRDVVARLNQVERHARRAFPNVQLPKPSAATGQRRQTTEGTEPTLTRDTAASLFETLRNLMQEEPAGAVEKELAGLGMADLRFLAQELGVSLGSKPTRKKLNSGIMGRINESILLSKNVNVSKPRSE